jgi:hypothetical protein
MTSTKKLLSKIPRLPDRAKSVLFSLPIWALRAAVAAAGLYFLWLFADLTIDRISFPGELEWMEGGVLAHVLQVLEGKPIYAEPDLEFTPFIYTPLYYWVCALLSPVFGASVSLLRAVSAACFFGSGAVIVAWSYRQNRSLVAGLTGAGLFAATFQLGGAWFDIARADTLLVFLLLAGGFLLFTFNTRNSAIASGVIFCLAFLTKQSAILPLCAVSGWAILTWDRRLLWFAGIALGSTFASWLLLHLVTHGWFSYYIFKVPSAHPLLDEWKLLFWKRDVFDVMAVPFLVLLFELGSSALSPKLAWRKLGFMAFVVGILLQVWSSRFHLGMYDNVLMPLHAVLGLTLALALGRLRQIASHARALETAVLAVTLGTLWNLEYAVENQRPTEAHLQHHKQLMARFSNSPKGAWAPYHSVPTLLAGNPHRSHIMAVIDIFRADPKQGERLTRQAAEALKEHRYPAIFWSRNDPSTAFFREPLGRYYRRAEGLQGPRPLTGWGQYITEVWVPRTEREPARPSLPTRRNRGSPPPSPP